MSTEETVRLVKTSGHGTLTFNVEESGKIRGHLPLPNVVFFAKNGKDASGKYVEILWEKVARRKSFAEVDAFTDSPETRAEAKARAIANPKLYFKDLGTIGAFGNVAKGVRVRFVDDGKNVVLYLGAYVSRGGLGIPISTLDGTQKILVDLSPEKMVLRLETPYVPPPRPRKGLPGRSLSEAFG